MYVVLASGPIANSWLVHSRTGAMVSLTWTNATQNPRRPLTSSAITVTCELCISIAEHLWKYTSTYINLTNLTFDIYTRSHTGMAATRAWIQPSTACLDEAKSTAVKFRSVEIAHVPLTQDVSKLGINMP